MRVFKLMAVLVAVVLMLAGLYLVGCGGDDCEKCCKCTCTNGSVSFGGECMDCEDVCVNGKEVPIFGHIDGCGEELESFEGFKEQSACD